LRFERFEHGTPNNELALEPSSYIESSSPPAREAKDLELGVGGFEN
jgi:hypothetical protein